ncbi:MAG: hypothetical protein KF839_09375 [Nitrosomonas sp.]|nr:hypothetical protein [Nitrosomonas sp.]
MIQFHAMPLGALCCTALNGAYKTADGVPDYCSRNRRAPRGPHLRESCRTALCVVSMPIGTAKIKQNLRAAPLRGAQWAVPQRISVQRASEPLFDGGLT